MIPDTKEFDDLCVARMLANQLYREFQKALEKAAKDETIADNMRDYWMCKADGQA